ncbi:MAG: hypothetical protein WCS72_05115 [Deltaproteobacteria bacterium]
MKRNLLVAAAIAALAFAVERSFRLEDDPIRSLVMADPVAAALFDRYQERSPFRGRIFVESDGLSPAEQARLSEILARAGYREVPFLAAPDPARLLDLASQLPAGTVDRLAGEEALRARVAEILAVAALPGGGEALRQLEVDPLGVGPALLERFLGAGRGGEGGGAPPRVYESPRPLVYAEVEKVEEALAALSPRVHYIGADFFAVENYRAVRRDVLLCSTLTLLLTLGLFVWFTRRWVLLWLLGVGSLVSYLAGVLAIRVFYAEIFAVVLVYTSTFVSFNTESLVHLSGIEEGRRARTLVGIWSAIGTTLLGMAVMLLGRSVLLRQMSIASIAGLLSFLVFLVPYRRTVDGIRFRTVPLPGWTAPRWLPAALCGASAAGLLLVGPPRVETRIDAFRYQSAALGREVDHFSRRLDAASLGDVVAVPATGSPSEALRPLAAEGLLAWDDHPLARFQDPAAQEATLAALRARWDGARSLLAQITESEGVRLELPGSPPGRRLGEWEYLELLGEVGPLRWSDEAGGRRFVHAGLRRVPPDLAGRGLVPLGPRTHYDALLTDLSRQLGWLFLAGFAAMVAYLAWIQRDAVRILYVFAPVLAVALGFAAWSRLTGTPLTIVHFMGFSLVIAIAVDYTAVAVSTDHGEVELSKILLTGLSAVATFGVLMLARHPILRSLGATVVAGAVPSLAFALLVRLRRAPGEAA